MPSFSRHDDRSTGRDVNGDGRVDERDDRYVAGMDERAAAERERTTGRDADGAGWSDADRDRAAAAVDRDRATTDRAAAAADVDRDRDAAADRAAAAVDRDRAAADRAAADADRDRADTETADLRGARAGMVDTDHDGKPDTPVAPVGPRPRASFMATLSLIFGMAGVALVLSGTLAGYGIALGAIAVLLSVFGLSATRRRHVAGKTDALLGFGIGAAAVVLGILALTGSFVWPTMETDWDSRLREWLDSQFIDRF